MQHEKLYNLHGTAFLTVAPFAFKMVNILERPNSEAAKQSFSNT